MEACEECGTKGQPGSEVAPYNFPRQVTRWLCVPSTGRPCRDLRYQRMREWLKEKGDK